MEEWSCVNRMIVCVVAEFMAASLGFSHLLQQNRGDFKQTMTHTHTDLRKNNEPR